MAGATLRPILLRNNAQVLGGGPIKGPNVVTMCVKDAGYISMSSDLEAILQSSWQATRAYALQRLDKQRAIYEFGCTWDPSEFASKVRTRPHHELAHVFPGDFSLPAPATLRRLAHVFTTSCGDP